MKRSILECPYFQQGQCIWASKLCNRMIEADPNICEICLEGSGNPNLSQRKYDHIMPQAVRLQCCAMPHEDMSPQEMDQWVKERKFRKLSMRIWWEDNKYHILNATNLDQLREIVLTSSPAQSSTDLFVNSFILGDKISKAGYTGVVAIPRSGLLPASVIATTFGLTLYCLDSENKIVRLGTGNRSKELPEKTKLIGIDDTAASGGSGEKFKKDHNIPLGVVYTTRPAKRVVDFYATVLDLPHILEWNFFGSQYLKRSYFDIDGVLSPNVPPKVDQDPELYRRWLRDVEPIQKNQPHFYPVRKLVTGRFEKHRAATEIWLEKHHVKYDELLMFPDELESERKRNHHEVVGKWKADLFLKDADAHYFVESEIPEAAIIKKKCHMKTVICTDGGNSFMVMNDGGN